MKKYQIEHQTLYQYSSPVSISHHMACLEPVSISSQRCLEWNLSIEPAPAVSSHKQDYFGNRQDVFTIQESHTSLSITSRATMEILDQLLPEADKTPIWSSIKKSLEQDLSPTHLSAYEMIFESPRIPFHEELKEYAKGSFPEECPLLKGALDLIHRIYTEFEFDPMATDVTTPVLEAFQKKRGVCQDFAHVAIACLRSLNIPTRYVSGYLNTHPPEGQEKLKGADASHAWLEVFSPGYGWIPLDPTNDLIPAFDHIVVAYGRDYSDVTPVRGMVTGGGSHMLSVSVDVSGLGE